MVGELDGFLVWRASDVFDSVGCWLGLREEEWVLYEISEFFEYQNTLMFVFCGCVLESLLNVFLLYLLATIAII